MKHKCLAFFISLFILPLLSSCSKQRKETSNEQHGELSVCVELVKEYSVNDSILFNSNRPKYIKIKNKRFDIQITLENNSDTAVAFVIMSCSWEENFIINTPYIEYVGQDCNKNVPREVIIKAHDKCILNTCLEKSKYAIGECETCAGYSKTIMTKLGFIYIPPSQDIDTDYQSIMEDKSRWHIIWSNPLLLNKQ